MEIKHGDEKSPNATLSEPKEQFWNDLFLLNAKIDIMIDEEEAPEAVEEAIISGISNLLHFQEPTPIPALQSLIEKANNVLIDQSSISFGAAKLQNVWQNYIKDRTVETYVSLTGSVFLLFHGKFCRSKYLSLSQEKSGKTTIDFLSHFLAANVNISIDEDKILQPIQVLLYMECAACAPPEASLGFLKMAEGVARGTEIQALFPGYRALRNYNKAVALNHLSRRDEALKAISIAFDEVMRNQDSLNKNPQVWRDYLHTPVLLIWADILQRMQFGKNSIDILSKIDVVADEQYDLSLYKNAKKSIYEALAWVDIGDLERCKDVIQKLVDDEDNKELFGKNIFRLLEDIVKDSQNITPKLDGLIAELGERQKIRYDAILIFIEYAVFQNGESLDLKKIQNILDLLEKVVGYYSADRITRHNLKQFVIECFGHLKKVAKKHFKDEELRKTDFDIAYWTCCLEQCLKCIEIPKDEEKGKDKQPYEIEGSISNEFWGKDFKKLESGLRDSVFDTTSELVDMLISYRIRRCESDYRDKDKKGKQKRHCKKNKKCVEGNAKDTLKSLVEFELNAMGLEIIDSCDVNYQGISTRGKGKVREDHDFVYPRKDSYWDRMIFRRGFYLAHVQRELLDKNPGENKDGCPAKLKDDFSWLKDELKKNGSQNLRKCLDNVIENWKKQPSEQQRTHSLQKMPPLEIDDYESIIRERDYLARLEAGRTEHPVGIFGSAGGIEFVSLRRWNSFTPELTFSRGGGYFVFVPDDGPKKSSYGGTYRKTKFGVVIDPGFDFVHNFFTQGFALGDIDIVLLTHAHHDHIDDFQGIADLLMESSKRGNREESKKIYAFMPLDSYSLVKRFIHEHAFRRFYNDTVIVDMNRLLPMTKDQKTELETYDLVEDTENKLRFSKKDDVRKNTGHCIKIQPVMASHNDYVTDNPCCVGYLLKFEYKGKPIADLGFTGDSQWFPEYAEHFQDCELVCSHLGSVLGDDNPEEYKKGKISHGAWESLIRKKNHPYLPGEILFLEQLRRQWSSEENGDSDKVVSDRAVVLSEFGEEMKGLMRVDLTHRFNTCVSKRDWSRFADQDQINNGANKCNSMHVAPADIGLRIAVRRGKPPLVHCAICDDYNELKRLEIEAYGHEEALFFVCGTCFRSKTHDVRATKYESIIEFGRVLRRESLQGPGDAGNKKDNK